MNMNINIPTQINNNFSIIYDFINQNFIVELYFDINKKTLIHNCTCDKKHYCIHIDYLVDYIYNSYICPNVNNAFFFN